MARIVNDTVIVIVIVYINIIFYLYKCIGKIAPKKNFQKFSKNFVKIVDNKNYMSIIIGVINRTHVRLKEKK